MNTKPTLAFFSLTLVFAAASTLFAQSERPRLPEPADPETQAVQPARPTAEAVQKAWPDRPVLTSALPDMLTSTDVTGWPVLAKDDERIGTLRDFVIDVQNGKIAYAIVGAGGVLGLGERRYAVPYSAIEVKVNDQNSLKIQMTEDQFAEVPRFDEDQLEELGQPETRRSLHALFQSPPAAAQQSETASTSPALQQHDIGTPQLRLASRLIGGDIRNGDEVIGEVHAILVNLLDGDSFVRLAPDLATVGTNAAFVLQFAQLDAIEGERDQLKTTLTVEDLMRVRPAFIEDPAAKVTE